MYLQIKRLYLVYDCVALSRYFSTALRLLRLIWNVTSISPRGLLFSLLWDGLGCLVTALISRMTVEALSIWRCIHTHNLSLHLFHSDMFCRFMSLTCEMTQQLGSRHFLIQLLNAIYFSWECRCICKVAWWTGGQTKVPFGFRYSSDTSLEIRSICWSV